MRRLLILTLILAVVLSGLILATHASNKSASTPLTAIQKFVAEQCDPHPCWRDIRPGKTSLAQAELILHTTPGSAPDNYPLCWETASVSCWNLTMVSSSTQAPQDPVGKMTFQPAPGAFHLGDAVSMFGDPISAMMCFINTPTNGDIGPEIQRPLMIAYISFKGGIKLVAYNPKDPMLRRMDINMLVYRLYYSQPGYDIYTPAWHGFSQQPKLGCNMG